MNTTERRRHDRALELASTRLDFGLGPIELAELESHLAGCPSCTRSVTAFDVDAMALRTPPQVRPSRRVDVAVFAAIDGREMRSGPRLLVLAAATALLIVVFLGIAAAGGLLLRGKPSLVVVPPPSAPGIVVADPSSSPSPRSTSGPDSPDSLILYAVGEDATATIHTIRPDGTGDRLLAAGADPAWSPDGHSIAYDCRSVDDIARGDVGDVCVMGSDGSNQHIAASDGHAARWSPDGNRLMFSRSMIDLGDTWIADRDGTNARLIGAGTGSWSPDGTRIMLVGASGATPDVTILRSDGTDAHSLGDCWDAAWSPDSSEIACTGEVDGQGFFHIVAAADGSIHRLYEDDFRMSRPAWVSPDQVAILRRPIGSPDAADDRLYLLEFGSASGFRTEPRLLLDLSVTGGIAVSPDGAWVAVTVPGDGTNDIYAVSVTGEERRVTTSGVTSGPAWQPRDPAMPLPSPSPSALPLPKFAALPWDGAALASDRTGWVATERTLYRTEDAGMTWAAVDVPAPYAPSLTVAPAADTIYLVQPGPPPTIAASHDGGLTWTQATIDEPGTASSVSLWFRTSEQGFATFALGDSSTLHVYETADGGRTWTGPAVAKLPDVGYGKAHGAPARGVLWLSNGKADGVPFDNRLLLSYDGGGTWVERRFPIGPEAPEVELKWPVAMWADGAGRIVLAMSLGDGVQIHVSDDDGRSWRFVRSWPSFLSGHVTVDYHVDLLSATEWVLVAQDGSHIWSTADGGAHWQQTTGPTRILLDEVSVASPASVWAIHRCDSMPPGSGVGPDPYCEVPGIRTVLLATSDGGRTWTSIGD